VSSAAVSVRAPRRSRRPRRPRASGAGAVLVVSAAALVPTAVLVPAPAAGALVAVIALAGVALLLRVRRLGSEALAAALGAALPLAAAAPFSSHTAAATVVAGASLAVVAVTAWRLRRRREWAPWYGAGGVLLASVAALSLLGVGGVVLVSQVGAGTTRLHDLVPAAMTTIVPWAVLVALGGWLRVFPTVALLVPPMVQLAVVVGS
jgi:hypothetical protein